MLHVTNGDSVIPLLTEAGVPGEILPWRDVLHEGPVPAGLPLEALSEVRARFIAARGWASIDEVRRSFAERDATLGGFSHHDEVVLWFEHDLYDQLQLIQLLDWFAAQDLGATALTLVCGAEYLGMSTPARLAERFGERAAVTDAQLALGEAAWNAFRSPDPSAIAALLAGDTTALPYLAAALRRHLEQFPATANGLSRSERQALEAIAAGTATMGDAFVASQKREDPVWLGDATFYAYLEGLAASDHPLLTVDSASLDVPDRHRGVRITDAGRAVLDGREDHARLNGIDRWLGGVHLHGREPAWRWDAGSGRLVASA